MKEFQISKVVNSKIAIFILQGYKDSKGKICDEKLIDLLPSYKRRELKNYYEVDIDELDKEDEVIFTCGAEEPIYCMFRSKFVKSEKAYTRNVRYVMTKKEWEKSLEQKEKNVTKKLGSKIELHQKEEVDCYLLFDISLKKFEFTSPYQLRLKGNIHKLLEKINFERIKYIKNDASDLMKVSCIDVNSTIDGDIILKVFFDENKQIKLPDANYAETIIDTNLSDITLKLVQNTKCSKYIDLSSSYKKDELSDLKKECNDIKDKKMNMINKKSIIITTPSVIYNTNFSIRLSKNSGKKLLGKDILVKELNVESLFCHNVKYSISNGKIEKTNQGYNITGDILEVVRLSFMPSFVLDHLHSFSTFSVMNYGYLFFNNVCDEQNEKIKKQAIKVNITKELLEKVQNDLFFKLRYATFPLDFVPNIDKLVFVVSENKVISYKIIDIQFYDEYLMLKLVNIKDLEISSTSFYQNIYRLTEKKGIYSLNKIGEKSNNDISKNKLINKPYNVQDKKIENKSQVNIQKTIEVKSKSILPDIIDLDNYNCSISYVREILFVRFKKDKFYHLINDAQTDFSISKLKHSMVSMLNLHNVFTVVSFPSFESIHCKSTLENRYLHLQIGNDNYKEENSKLHNSNYHMFEKKNILKKHYNYSFEYFAFFDSAKTKDKLQLIKSSNNHATRSHSVEEQEIQMVYYDKKTKKYNTISIIAFYCQNCRTYFCFYEQFISELNRYKLSMSDFLGNFYDEYHNDLNRYIGLLHTKSILNKYGYSVSKQNDLSSNKRNRILRFIIDKGIMNKAQIISHIQYLIHYNGKKAINKDAVQKWKEDIDNLRGN